ncbi:MAG: hypothetical protein JW864_14325 [Spirochaetes bacterium]|nr:hypothetical protein [Spirochaetota bacterium]
MKRFFITLILFFIVNPPLSADSAYVVFTPRGNVESIKNDLIRMKNEKVNITLFESHIEVKVDYTFENTGSRQKVLMGFPNSKDINQAGSDFVYGINDFRAFEGNKKLKVFRTDKEGEKGKHPAALYECFEVKFNEGEIKQITNIYSQQHNRDNSDNICNGYTLTTGASWKDNIEKINIQIKSMLPSGRMKKISGYFIEDCEKCEIVKIDYDFRIIPEKYSIDKNIIKMEFNDIEPDFDIKIVIPPEVLKSVYASSELESGTGKYSVKNLVDDDPATAWVEGKKGYGINEFLRLSTNPFFANNAGAYKISKIGIINGYAKDSSTFKKNSRVKKIRIDYQNYMCCGNCCKDTPAETRSRASLAEKGSAVFILEDTMKMQYLKFEEPVYSSELTITIVDVYKGTKWDDTCISGIVLFTDD